MPKQQEKNSGMVEPKPLTYRDIDEAREILTALEVELMTLRADRALLLKCAQLMTVRADELAIALEALSPDPTLARKIISSTSPIHTFKDKETQWIVENVTQPAERLAAAFPKLVLRIAREGSLAEAEAGA